MIEKNIIDVLEENFIPFAGETLLNNLPSVADGLLTSHRKVLYALEKNGVSSNKSHIKLLRAAAMAMTYYVYGDLPLNKVMKGMGNNSLNYMYLNPKGSFGDKQKRDGVGASARYIECKLSTYAEDMMTGIKKGNVLMKRNFDNTDYEPIVLPSMMPNVLLNTSQSIAVGESSKIPAHNLNEVCDSFISYLESQDINKSISLLNGADLSLGGQIVYDKGEFEKIYRTGRGSFTLVGKYIYDEKENKVTITEIPYETYIEVIEEKLRQQYDKGNFKEILDIHDGSDKDGIALHIYLKKGTNLTQFINKLRKYTPFESKMSCNFTLIDIDNKTPMLMSLEDIIVKWTQHRKQCLKRELQYDIQQLQSVQNELLGLQIILQDLDEAISLIRSSKSEKEAIDKLREFFNLNDKQLEYIVKIRMVNMNKEWLTSKINKLTEVNKQLKVNMDNLESDSYYTSTIISQLQDVKKKYGQPRRTTIIHEDSIKTVSNTDLIEEYNCTVVVTKQYIKKNLRYLDKQRMKDGDSILTAIQCNNKDKLLAFTDKGQVFTINVNDIQQCMPSDLGQFQNTFFNLSNECVVGVVKYEEDKSATLITQEGKCLVLPYSLLQGRKKQAISLGSKFKDNKLIYANEYSRIVTIVDNKNTKEYDVNFDYYSGRPSNGGNFILNCRNGKKVISEVFSC